MERKLTKRQLNSMANRMLRRAETTNFLIVEEEKSYLHYGNNKSLIRYFHLNQLLKIQLKAYNRLKNYSYNCSK
jgi:hypothetical protein